jgi:hypothetical protein
MEVSAAGAVVIPPPPPRKETAPLPVEVEPIQSSYWWPLWKHMHDEHGLVLLESECSEIAAAVDAVRNACRVATADETQSNQTEQNDT